ncbi:MAG: hypothetical protein AB1918_04030 [Pseudomonadota bacterium]
MTAGLMAVAMSCAWASAGALAADITLSPKPPTKLAANATQQDADTAGWQMMVAFSWPAKAGQRGVPDTSKKFGDPGPMVWETWKSPDEVFYPDGRKPAPWNSTDAPVPPECLAAGAKGDGSTPPVFTRTVADRTNQAVGGSLTDQNGNLVHYTITFNKNVFDFIYDNGYYNKAGQDKMTKAVDYPAGTAEMKASWRVLLPSESEEFKSRFLRRQAYVYNPAMGGKPATCALQEVGLLGMHFNLKVTYPDKTLQWLGATFEQVDNVPPFAPDGQPGKDPAHTLPYSLFDKKCYDPTANCVYNLSTEQGRDPTTPTQVTRLVNIDPAAQLINPQWQAAFAKQAPDSPWRFYEMITTQYPAKPSQKPVGGPSPALSANTTMETYVPRSSCLNCHYTAKDVNAKYFADYSFMLAQACPKPLFPPPGGGSWPESPVCK